MTGGAAAWADALLAIRLFAADPHRMGGIHLRARPGPARDRWIAILRAALGEHPIRTVPAGIATDRLIGGIDLTATLERGRPVAQAGLLNEAHSGVVLVPMAERMAKPVASALIEALDRGEISVERDGLSLTTPAQIALVLIDEGEGGETPPDAIVDRLALNCTLDGISIRDLNEQPSGNGAAGEVPDPAATLCEIAEALGIASARAPILALATARAAARVGGRLLPDEGDIAMAARLSLFPKATRLPAPASETPPAPELQPNVSEGTAEGALADRIVEAVAATLPENALAGLDRAAARSRQSGRGSGALRSALTSGRPIGARAGKPDGKARLHLVETLRAAAPWQRVRRGNAPGVSIRASDFRVHRFAERSESTLIFAVDASGSAAAERLAETKGAVELLLAEAYVKRTQVAMVAFRGEGAEILLPPTRSLVRAKRELSRMMAGGGTPLAAGVDAALSLAEDARSKGRAPFVVMLTDGRANVARDGGTGRSAAEADAKAAARRMGASGVRSIVIDVAARPRDEARQIAAAMAADFAALPRADANALRAVVAAASV